MSGILGVWNSQKPAPWQKMLGDLNILGRDGQGDWHDSEVGLSLGRTQLFNTPESCLEKPVIEYEGCVLVWNGRVDDRESLLAGRTKITDAQLIIESYCRWGVDCLKHLIGEFVFILWDASKDLLFVGCDPVGGRTISYYWDGQTLLLSSRVLTLLHHPQVSKELDQLYLAHALCYLWAQPPGITPFAAIKRLRPGFAITISSGHFSLSPIERLTRPKSFNGDRSPEVYYDKFWCLLNQATKDRLRTHRPVCTTLSGGLDSTTITVSVLNHLSSVDAFSNVTTVFTEFDERQPIQSFLERYPQVRWHDVNCDRAWAFSESLDSLPVTDDPLVAGTTAMNVQLYQNIQKLGFGNIFDGEWGDNLFAANIQDFARSGSWRGVIKQLQNTKRWHSSLWKYLLLPHLPTCIQHQWFARWQRQLDPTPVWLKSAFTQQPETKAALRQYFTSFFDANLETSMSWTMECSGSVGTSQVYKLFQSSLGLEFVSPFQDRRLIQFALDLHPLLQHDSTHNKIFLRRANQKTLPEDILWRPKTNYFDPLRYAGLGQGDRVLNILDFLKNSSFFSSIVNVYLIEKELNKYRVDYQSNYDRKNYFKQDDTNFLYAIFAFTNWYKKIQKQYL
ncbi:MAG: hypothetical protein RLZZ381_782 [Cyanobacteriota bacterium]|jgi:asparagine synthase (glutamine-hydrolysing)